MSVIVDRELSSPRAAIEHHADELYGILFDAGEHTELDKPALGITLREDGCDFAVHTGDDVLGVDFCVVNPIDPGESIRWRLHPSHNNDNSNTYTGFIPDVLPGDLYGLRVERAKDPNSYDTLLLDPYAKAITRLGLPDHPSSPAYGVIAGGELSATTRPNIAPEDRVIYESHIKNATMLHPDIPEELRGTYLGFCHPAHIEHLKSLGVTTVEVLPIMQFFSEEFLANAGRVNAWGYNTAGFFAPHEGYAHDKTPGAAIGEVKTMIDTLHAAGIEIVLDVVYNHTSEGGIDSPAHSLRGLDNEGYYRTYTDNQGRQNYFDATGCGNNIDSSKPAAAGLIWDSLSYWHETIGADGFRFDLAHAMIGDGSLFTRLKEDERFRDCLLIAEPWSIYEYPRGLYAHAGIAEWDGEYRNYVRGFWGKGKKNLHDLKPFLEASMGADKTVNFITAHDGFTLHDLTAYETKHNELNGENNRDGTNDNRSDNHGHEGPTDNTETNNLRQRTARNLLATLAMSRGIPMILDGDDRLHTQLGNNNSYCQDNLIAWRNWDLSDKQKEIGKFIQSLLAIRRQSSLGNSAAITHDIPASPIGERGIDWFNLWGLRMRETDPEWHGIPVFSMYSSGLAGENTKDSLLYYLNGSGEDVYASLPRELAAKGDYVLLANTDTGATDLEGTVRVPEIFPLKAMSSVILRRVSCVLPPVNEPVRDPLELGFVDLGHNMISINHS